MAHIMQLQMLEISSECNVSLLRLHYKRGVEKFGAKTGVIGIISTPIEHIVLLRIMAKIVTVRPRGSSLDRGPDSAEEARPKRFYPRKCGYNSDNDRYLA